MAQDANGKDMPTGDMEAGGMKMRATETGYGATVQEINAGYCTVPETDTDSRIGVMAMGVPPPRISLVGTNPMDEPSLQGFLQRPPIAVDR